MMVHFIYTLIACATVRNSWKFKLLTELAIFMCKRVVIIEEFFVSKLYIWCFIEEGYSIFDSDSLNITPKTHKYIKVSQ